MTKKRVGDLLILPDGHRTIVVAVNEDGMPVKVKSLEPDDQLGKIGWFREGDDWMIIQYDILTDN